jgi:YidC/Oxa1 family membrane protein insertase
VPTYATHSLSFSTPGFAAPFRQAMIYSRIGDADGRPFNLESGSTLSLNWAISVSCMTSTDLARLSPDERQLEYTDAYYSFFKSIAKIMTWLLRWIAHVVHYYGLAVIILTILIKAALHRLTHKQYESTMRMQKLQPELKYLQEQYKNDKATKDRKTMELWKKHGVNPLGGCLPMLVQIPLFIALYQSFYHSADMRGQSFLWIADLTLPDQLWYLGVKLPIINTLVTINPLPILYILTTIWMSMLQKPPTAGDPSQEQIFKMMRWMPAVFGVIFYNMPAGLVLYFTLQAVLTAIEIKLVKRRLGMT